MTNTDNEERLIDMDKLKTLLKDEYYLTSRGLSSEYLIQINEYGNILKENLQKNMLRQFILDLKRLFYLIGEPQEQMLMAQFLKETFSSQELEKFKKMIGGAPRYFLTTRIKAAILNELS